MDFFPDPPPPFDDDACEDPPQPVWTNAPEDVIPGVAPLELVLGRSASAVVVLTGVRAFPTGLAMTLGVRIRGKVRRQDLNAEVFDGPYAHAMPPDWQTDRLKWGFEFADGRRATNVDPSAWTTNPTRTTTAPTPRTITCGSPTAPSSTEVAGAGARAQ